MKLNDLRDNEGATHSKKRLGRGHRLRLRQDRRPWR